MPRRGENIYKRKDGRWEARYIYSFKEDGSPRYRSIYAADYLTVKKKQNDAKRKMDPRLFQSVRMKKNISFYGLLWLERLKPSSKESTYVRYHYLFSHYISPMIGDRLVYTFSNKDCEVFLNKLLLSGKSDGSGLAPKTVTDIRSVIKLILKTAEKEGELSLCNPELCPVKPVRKPLRILSLKEQQALQDYLLGKGEFTAKSGHILYMGALMYLAAQILLIIRDLIFRFFYAMENTKDTVSNSIISCVFNIIMSLILVKPLGMYGVILGTFISGAISMVMILFRMKKLYGLEKFGLNLFELIKNIIVLVISVFAIILIKKHIIIENDVMAILIYGVLTVIIFVILAIIFKLKAIKIKL